MANPIRKFLGLNGESRALSFQDIWGSGLDSLSSSGTTSGKRVNKDSALQVSTVWGAVRVLSDGVATLPMDSYIRTKGVRKGFARPGWMSFATGPYSKIDVVSQMMVSLLLDGNAYVATYRANDGSILFLEVLDPDAVSPVQNPDTREISYEIHSSKGVGTATVFDVLHIRGMAMPGQIEGLSPVSYMRETIGLSLAAQEFGATFFGNGALPGVVIEAEGAISDAGQKAMKRGWNEMHQGTSNAHRLAILTEGAKLNKVTISPEDAQFLQTRGFQVNDIARIYGVPVNLLQHSDGPEMGQSLSDKNTHFVQHSLRPWVERIEAGFSWLMWSEGAPRQAFVKFNMDGLMRGDHETRYATYSLAVTQGILTINEARAYEDLPPVPWGDEPISVQVKDDDPQDIPTDNSEETEDDNPDD